MVGRLVQNQQVDIPAHEHTKAEAAPLSAGESAHGREHVLPPKAEGGQPVPRLLGLAAAVVEHGIQRTAAVHGEADDLGQIWRADMP